MPPLHQRWGFASGWEVKLLAILFWVVTNGERVMEHQIGINSNKYVAFVCCSWAELKSKSLSLVVVHLCYNPHLMSSTNNDQKKQILDTSGRWRASVGWLCLALDWGCCNYLIICQRQYFYLVHNFNDFLFLTLGHVTEITVFSKLFKGV